MKQCIRFRFALLSILIMTSLVVLTACDMTEDLSITTWDKTFPIGSRSGAGRVIETQDGGFLAVVTIYDKVSLLKVNSQGDQEWYCHYSNEDRYTSRKYDLRETPDGYVLALSQSDKISARIIHTDKSGLETRSITVGDSSIKEIRAITLTPENSLTVLAQSESDVVVMGFDETGTAIWNTHYGTADDEAQIIHKTKTGYVAAGFCTGMTRMFKLDDVGGVVWRRTLPMGDLLGFGGAEFGAIDETDDGGFKAAVTICDKNGYGCRGSIVYSIAPSGLTTGKTMMLSIFVNSIRHTPDNGDRKSTRLNSSHNSESRMPSSA
jgi:hypothetical protein